VARSDYRLHVLVVINFIDRRYFQQIFVPIALEYDCCPSCGYELTGLPVDEEIDDGCTVCPECSAAWRRGVIQEVNE